MSVWTIYLLRDPDDPAIGYVGQTRHDPVKRLAQHFHKAKKGVSAKQGWVEDCKLRGVMPSVEALESCPTLATANYAEKVWIRKLRESGMTLVNGASGGQRDYGPEHGARVREALRNNPEAREAIATASRTRWADPAGRKRHIDGMKEAQKRPGTRKKKAAAGRANLSHRWANEAEREKLISSYRESWQRPDRIEKNKAAWRDPAKKAARLAKIAAANRTSETKAKRRRSAEWARSADNRAKISQEAKARWADPEYKARVGAAISVALRAKFGIKSAADTDSGEPA